MSFAMNSGQLVCAIVLTSQVHVCCPLATQTGWPKSRAGMCASVCLCVSAHIYLARVHLRALVARFTCWLVGAAPKLRRSKVMICLRRALLAALFSSTFLPFAPPLGCTKWGERECSEAAEREKNLNRISDLI